MKQFYFQEIKKIQMLIAGLITESPHVHLSINIIDKDD